MENANPLTAIKAAAARIATNLDQTWKDLYNDDLDNGITNYDWNYYAAEIVLHKLTSKYNADTLARVYDASDNLPDYRPFTRNLANGEWATGRGLTPRAAKAHIVTVAVRDAILESLSA